MMIGLRSVRAPRLRAIDRTLALLALLLPTLAIPAQAQRGNADRTVDLGDCEKLQVPVGSQLAFHVYAVGVQIYHWSGSSWTFDGPAAVLFADAGSEGEVGIHFAGPTWLTVSGSRVVGKVLDRCTSDADAIPWLLLEAEDSGPGVFRGVNRIQRVNTAGGNAPSSAGSVVGDEVKVPYTAEYYFYRVPE
jgi:hypothetical protein